MQLSDPHRMYQLSWELYRIHTKPIARLQRYTLESWLLTSPTISPLALLGTMYSLRLFIRIWSQLASDGAGIGSLSASFQSSFLKNDAKLTDAFNIPMIVFLSIL